MATELGGIVTNLDGLLTMILLDLLIRWSCKIARQTKTILSPLPQNVDLPWAASTHKVSCGFAISCDTLKTSLPPQMPMAAKLSWMTTPEGPPPLMLLDSLIRWSCKITWQTKFVKEHLHYTFFASHFLIIRLSVSIAISHMIFYNFCFNLFCKKGDLNTNQKTELRKKFKVEALYFEQREVKSMGSN